MSERAVTGTPDPNSGNSFHELQDPRANRTQFNPAARTPRGCSPNGFGNNQLKFQHIKSSRIKKTNSSGLVSQLRFQMSAFKILISLS